MLLMLISALCNCVCGSVQFDKATEMTTTVKEAGAVPNGPCIIVPKYTQ